MTTYADFMAWKQDPVTVKFFQDISDRIEEIKQRLVEEAGQNPENDCFYRGYAKACYNILDTEFVEGDD